MTVYIGLMSGTSMDGVDGVLVSFATPRPSVQAHVHRPFEEAMRNALWALNTPAGDEIHRAALAANQLARAYANVVRDLLALAGKPCHSVRALGAHGQTVRHRPGEFDGVGYSVQLLNGSLLAELTGIDVVCDFRSRDIAAGGQGAPLVPAFHAGLFARPNASVAVLNLGGIANLTLVGPGGQEVTGFDCGPGNALLDAWSQKHLGTPLDAGGQWAARGRVVESLLGQMLAEPYFARRPPKSTGRDLFNPVWLDAVLATHGAADPTDVQATLSQLTVEAAAAALEREGGAIKELLVCGGGAFNHDLMRRLAQRLPHIDVSPTSDDDVPVDQVEALAFAWLAKAHVDRRAGNLPAVTGARSPRVLGALHPAS